MQTNIILRHWLKRMLGAVWSGPFSLGPLKRPATVGDIIAKMLEVIWKSLMALVAAALAIGATVGVASLWTQATSPQPSDIQLIAKARDPECDPDLPFSITATNESSSTVSSLTYSIQATEEGRSTNLVKRYAWESDFLISPGKTVAWCIETPRLEPLPDGRVIWRAQPRYATFG